MEGETYSLVSDTHVDTGVCSTPWHASQCGMHHAVTHILHAVHTARCARSPPWHAARRGTRTPWHSACCARCFMSTQYKLRDLREESILTEEMPPLHCPGGKPVGRFLDQWLMSEGLALWEGCHGSAGGSADCKNVN